MDQDMVATAQQREPLDVGEASHGPRRDVVGIEVAGLVTAGEGAGGVAQTQRSALGT